MGLRGTHEGLSTVEIEAIYEIIEDNRDNQSHS